MFALVWEPEGRCYRSDWHYWSRASTFRCVDIRGHEGHLGAISSLQKQPRRLLRVFFSFSSWLHFAKEDRKQMLNSSQYSTTSAQIWLELYFHAASFLLTFLCPRLCPHWWFYELAAHGLGLKSQCLLCLAPFLFNHRFNLIRVEIITVI